MEALAHTNFEYGFRPIYYFSRIAGLWPFSFVHHLNGTIQNARISRLDGTWFFISVCLHLLAIFYSHLDLDLVDKNDSNITTITFGTLYMLYRMISLLIGAVGIALDMINRHELANIMGKFIIFDNGVGYSIHDSFYSISLNNVANLCNIPYLSV